MLYGGDGPGPLLTAAHANGWKMEDTDRNNCLSWLIILCVGLADNCTFIFTTKYTDTLCKESSWSRLLSLPKEETWFIAPLPDKTRNHSAGAERNFSGDSPWVINYNSSSQAQGPSLKLPWLSFLLSGFIFVLQKFCVWRRNLLHAFS